MFLSSHLMSEMAQTADQLLVIGRGRIITAGPVQDVIDSVIGRHRHGALTQPARAGRRPGLTGGNRHPWDDGAAEVHGVDAAGIGDLAAARGIAVHELAPRRASLEEAYLSLTQDAVEYRSDTTAQEGSTR